MPSANTGADALPPKIASNNTYELVLPNGALRSINLSQLTALTH